MFTNYIAGSPPLQVPVKAIEGRLYVRISAHIYNTPQDYRTLSAAVMDIVTS